MNRRIVKQIGLIIVCLMMIIMMWEGQKTDAAVAATAIPEQSIRLRILANSDAPGDQLVKREIRDAVVAQMGEWVAELENPQSLDEARKVIREHLSEIENRVGEELGSRGLNYEYQVELGSVPFPTKLYGGTVYPAGDYEAVRITLGKAKVRTGGVCCSRHCASLMQEPGMHWRNLQRYQPQRLNQEMPRHLCTETHRRRDSFCGIWL